MIGKAAVIPNYDYVKTAVSELRPFASVSLFTLRQIVVRAVTEDADTGNSVSLIAEISFGINICVGPELGTVGQLVPSFV